MNRDPVGILRYAREAELVDEKGRRVELHFADPLVPEEIDALRGDVDVRLPHELVAVLGETRAIDGIESVDFTGGRFLDLTPDETETAPVLYLCHDPPVVAYQSPSLGAFPHELFRAYEPPHESDVKTVHDDRVFDVWRANPGVLNHATALAGDEELRTFAASLDEAWEFIDLRAPEIGMGFSWGRYGARTEIRRDGYTAAVRLRASREEAGPLRSPFQAVARRP